MKNLIPFLRFKKINYLIILLFSLHLSVTQKIIANEINKNHELINTNPTFKKQEKFNSNDLNSSDLYLENDIYILGPGDQLLVTIFDFEELSGEYFILNDGTISLPFGEEIYIKGLSLNQANLKISSILSNEIIDPQVKLRLLVRRPIVVSLVGEIKRPGTYSFPPKEVTDKSFPSLVQAIQKAGGINPQSDLTSIQIKRKMPLNNEDIKYKAGFVNLLDLILEGSQDQNLLLFDGDIISINKSESYESNHPQIISNISPETINVIVAGEVESPGYKELPSGATLNEALLASGGLKRNRANKKVFLINTDNSGKIRKKEIKIDLLNPLTRPTNPLLSNNDIIQVNRNNITRITDPIGITDQPLDSLIKYATLFKLLSD